MKPLFSGKVPVRDPVREIADQQGQSDVEVDRDEFQLGDADLGGAEHLKVAEFENQNDMHQALDDDNSENEESNVDNINHLLDNNVNGDIFQDNSENEDFDKDDVNHIVSENNVKDMIEKKIEAGEITMDFYEILGEVQKKKPAA